MVFGPERSQQWRGFSKTITLKEPAAQRRHRPPQQFGRDGRCAVSDLSDRRQIVTVEVGLLKQEIQHCRNKQQQGHALARHGFEYGPRLKPRYKYLLDRVGCIREYGRSIRQMEGWGRMQIDVVLIWLIDLARVIDIRDDISVREHYALRLAGRARSIE